MADRVGQQLGNYRLLRKIGQGAFAEVYLAEHLYLERPAAIKILHVQIEPKAHEPFRREARTIAHLQHPHIVQVLDFGLDDQTPYLVMEYTPGGTLRSHHPRGTRLPLDRIITYVNQIASALDYAHQQRVIHRDIKPENLLLNARHEIVLSDFGLAVVQRTLDSLSTQDPAGTPLYMAPEQIQRHPCAASDQYALGIIVYEWLAGEAPFRGALFEVFSHHLYQPPPSLCQRVPDLPVAIEEAVFKALAKDPQHRFACVEDFALALEEACDATQPLPVQRPPKRQTHKPTGSQNTWFVPPSPVRERAEGSFSTQPQPMTMQRPGQGQEGVSGIAPGPVLHKPSVSKVVKPLLAQSNRQRFLHRVRAFWIEGVLDHSLHGAALLALGLQDQRDALANPWQLVLEYPATAPCTFPAGTRITEVYDAANGELLILGAPGSGKTTLLLEVARDLLDRAQDDEQQLMPVVFNLSSWATRQLPLKEWMVEELIGKYQVPRKLARAWVDGEQILPLLDGLDEVAPQSRTACIATINTYREEHGLLPLVVASRSADYLEQSGRLRLSRAVTIQSLTQQQVEDYLARGGESLWALRVALHQDAALRELTQTPLMLSILTLTYHDLPVEDLLRGGIAPTRQQVFEHYTKRMLRPRGTARPYTQEQTTHWLSRLARQLKQHNQTEFYLERMQPTWLAGDRSRRMYERLAVRLPGVLMGILISLSISMFIAPNPNDIFTPNIFLGGLLGWLLSEGSIPQQPMMSGGKSKSPLVSRLLQWLLIGTLLGFGRGLSDVLSYMQSSWPSDPLIYGLSGGLIFGLCSILLQFFVGKNHTPGARSPTPPLAKGTIWQHLRRKEVHIGLLVGLSIGLSGGLSDGLLYLLSGRPSDLLLLGYGPSYGLSYVLGYVLSGGVLAVLFSGTSTEVQPTDQLVWSWRSLGKSLFSKSHVSMTVQISVLIWLVYLLSHQLIYQLDGGAILVTANSYFQLIFEQSTGLSTGLSYWFLSGLFQGVSGATIEDQRRIVPNQGIHRSALNGCVFGLLSIVIVGLLSGLSFALSGGLSYLLFYVTVSWRYVQPTLWPDLLLLYGLESGLLVGMLAGVLVGLLKGGLASFRHYVLRFLLRRTDEIPRRYVRFLDYAAERVLLRKVGGGYIFVHRLLLEYFASLDTTLTPEAAKAKKQRASQSQGFCVP